MASEDLLLSQLAELAGDTTVDPLTRHDRAVTALFGGQETRHFEYLVTRFTTPEELVGTVNIEVLKGFTRAPELRSVQVSAGGSAEVSVTLPARN